MSAQLCRTIVQVQKSFEDCGKPLDCPMKMIAAIAVIKNPWYGKGASEDLCPALRDVVPSLGDLLTAMVHKETGDALEGYGKATVVGLGGAVEHGQALVDELRFGNAYGDEVNTKSRLAFTNVRGAMGTPIMIPLMYEDAGELGAQGPAICVSVPDGPADDEIVVALGGSIGGDRQMLSGSQCVSLEELGADTTRRRLTSLFG